MKVKIFSATFPLPAHKTEGAAGMDLQADLLNQTMINDFFRMVVDAKNEKNYDVLLDVQTPPTTYKNQSLYIEIPPRWRVRIPTGLYTECPVGMRFEIMLRSSIGWKKGLIIPNAPGLIDADFRGQWHIVLFNPNNCAVMIEHGEHIAQLVLSEYKRVEWEPVQRAAELSGTERGAGGFGSTGK
jgi:dUTP pyrophosphatase